MLFNSYIFICVFLPVAYLGYMLASRANSRRPATAWLAVCSIAFYAWWSPPYVFLLLLSILVNFSIGRKIRNTRSTGKARAVLIAGIAANLGALAYFKYTNFFLDTVNLAFHTGMDLGHIILPIGISFFTFQQIAFLVDSYQDQIDSEYNLIDYALFVSFFPQLIAGPIVHHGEMMPQLARRPSSRKWTNLSVGVTIFTIGLSKKVILADSIATFATPIFDAADLGHQPTLVEGWIGALAFTFQLYFDFSGYSDMAIGLGRMFGIRLPANFNSPYKASSIVEFWQRWHITLSRFLKDYLYIPLGGNRKGNVRRYANLMTTMLLGGLWHGAGWNFVLWGFIHGLLLCVNHAWFALQKRLGLSEQPHGPVRRGLAVALTFFFVVLAWVFFRAETFDGAFRMLHAMLGFSGLTLGSMISRKASFFWITGLLALVWLAPNTQQIMARWRPVVERIPRPARHKGLFWHPSWHWAVGIAALGFVAFIQLSRISEFIYYQF
ncbi:MAG: MBOAT family protein [bacterium]|nr:MBOAT family protein [bacterium]